MSFNQQFDPSQAQAQGFAENGGNGTPQQQQGMMPPQGGIPQGQGQEQDPNAFQGQGGMEQGGMPGGQGGDSKTTLW